MHFEEINPEEIRTISLDMTRKPFPLDADGVVNFVRRPAHRPWPNSLLGRMGGNRGVIYKTRLIEIRRVDRHELTRVTTSIISRANVLKLTDMDNRERRWTAVMFEVLNRWRFKHQCSTYLLGWLPAPILASQGTLYERQSTSPNSFTILHQNW
jgi:hypothetical protein